MELTSPNAAATWPPLPYTQCPIHDPAKPPRPAGGRRSQIAFVSVSVLPEPGHVPGDDHRAFDLVPTRVLESGCQLGQAFLLLWVMRGQDAPLRFGVVEAAGFAISTS
jgi:hypothetical protein